MRGYLKKIGAMAVSAVALIGATTSAMAETMLVELHGLWAIPRMGPEVPYVDLKDQTAYKPQYVDLRNYTGLRYQVQGASCGPAGCTEFGDDVAVMLEASFDNGTTWAPLGTGGAAFVRLTPRSTTYTPPLKPTVLVTIPTNQRKNNALLKQMVDYTYFPYTTVGDATVQFYK